MPRPPLPIGSWGVIRTYPSGEDDRGRPRSFIAVAQYRDFDGVTRQVQASGRTATAATQNLRLKLQNRVQEGRRGELTMMTRFKDAADLWIARIDTLVADERRSPGSAATYRGQLKNHVLPALGEVRLGEVTTPLVDRVLSSIRVSTSPATAKTCRSVISGVMGLAVRHGAIPANPVREVERIESGRRRGPRALTAEERELLMRRLSESERSVRWDLPDLVFFMLATGVRIGEALALLWSDVDLRSGTVAITRTLIRVKGEGLVRKSTKSASGERVLVLPPSAVAVLRRRFATGGRLDQPIFPSIDGGFRDPCNVRREFRLARGDDAQLGWVTTHTFRRTAATILDEAAISPRLVADQLGHARPSMTQDFYLGRRGHDPKAAAALDDALRGSLPGTENHGKTMGKSEGQDR